MICVLESLHTCPHDDVTVDQLLTQRSMQSDVDVFQLLTQRSMQCDVDVIRNTPSGVRYLSSVQYLFRYLNKSV